ncbi:MAG: IclR family transcriptional regulator [Pseudomonadota bacterium]
MTDQQDTVRVDSTLSKGLAILEHLAASPSGKGVTEIARDLDLTKSNTFRLLQTLTRLGYATHLDNKSYAATLKTWQVGRALVENLNLRQLAAPELNELSQETGETIYLAVPENLRIVYIDKIDSRKPIRSWNAVGGSAPIHCVGTGKAVLSANYAKYRDKLVGNLTRHTERTLTSMERLDVDIAAATSRGFAIDTGEFRERVLSFGAPIILPSGDAVAAIGISLPDINLQKGEDQRFGELVMGAARRVSQKLLSR